MGNNRNPPRWVVLVECIVAEWRMGNNRNLPGMAHPYRQIIYYL